jgi:methanobactin biosynthesis MbnP-like protein
MKKSTFLKIFTLTFILLSVLNCKKDDDSGFGLITLQLDHTVKEEPVEIEQIKYLCEAGHTYSVVNLKYYLSEIVLHRKDGSTFSNTKVHLCELSDLSTKQYIIDDVPDGDYTKLSFIFGLDETTNVDGGLENTVENINMEWPIPGDQGYHYMKFEGRYDSLNTGVIKSFNIHTGATMGNQNYIEITLPFTEAAVRSNSWTININVDLNEWFQNPHTFDFASMESIMMDQAAQEMLKANGATVFSITSVRKN